MLKLGTEATMEVAGAMVAMWRVGQFLDAGERFWAEDVVSVEPSTGEGSIMRGRDALRAKGQWWLNAHEIHSFEVGDPYFNGDSFIVRFVFDLTVRETGQRKTLDELGVFKVAAGKISTETYFVTAEYFDI